MDAKKVNGSGTNGPSNEWRVKVGLAEMLKGGVIMDVTNAEQARIAEKAGACAVMALERVPSDIRKEGGVARMASIKVIREIMATVTIPVMAKVRIDRKSTRLNSSHLVISYAVFCLKKKKYRTGRQHPTNRAWEPELCCRRLMTEL